MQKLQLFLASALIALLSMPPNINLLGLLGGNFEISLMPPTLTLGLLLGINFMVQRSGQFKQLLANTNRYLLVFLVLASLSVLWSDVPGITIARLYRLYGICFISLGVCMGPWDDGKFERAVRPGLIFIMLGSIIYFFLNPADALMVAVINGRVQMELLGAWKGIAMHKNILGSISSVAVIIYFHGAFTRRSDRFGSIFGLLCSLTCLIGSKSNTSLFASLFAIAIIILILKARTVKKRRTIRIFSFLLMIFFVVYSLGVLNIVPGLSAIIEPIVAMTGKDMTFSGRTSIWDIMKVEIAKHPFLGSGYASFWLRTDPLAPSLMFMKRLYFDPSEAHNGYLDIINELGFVGGFALIGYIFTFLRQSILLLSHNRQKSALFIGLMFAQLIANMSEAHWWRMNSVDFYVMTLATFDLARAILESKRPKATPVHRQTRTSEQHRDRTSAPGFGYDSGATPVQRK